jgi:hypothetical protein
MQAHTGTIQRIQRDAYGHQTARIDFSGLPYPTPGRYTLAVHAHHSAEILGQALFPMGICDPLEQPDIPMLGPIPTSWNLGDELTLHPPAGRGFHIPPGVHHLALAAFGSTPARLLPLVQPALQSGADIVLFTPSPELSTTLPPDVEIQPIHNLSQALPWAAFLAIEIPLEKLADLRDTLQLDPHDRIPCPTQALVWTAMPCAALGRCGACAVPTRRHQYELACQTGPVFDLKTLQW